MKKSINSFQIVGTLLEKNLQVEEKEVTLKGANGVEKKVTCKSISKKDFKNPSITVETTCGGVVGASFYPTHEKKLDENGKVVDNPRFKSIETVINNYVAKADANGETPTRVKVDCSISPNEYVNDKDEFVSLTPQLNIFTISSTNVPEDDCTDGDLSGIIRTIKSEVRTKNDDTEETGRLIVEFYTFDNNGVTTPINVIVPEDIADDFTDIYEVGSSALLNVEVVTKQVGGKKQTGGFGHRDTKKVSGFNITEFCVFNGQNPYEEESEYYVTKEEFKKALSERKVMIDAKIEQKKSNTKESTGKKGLGSRPSKVEDDNPFVDDDTTTTDSTDEYDPFSEM